MKILMIDQHFYPEQFTVNDICFQMAKDGHDVTVLTGLPNYPSGIIEKEYRWLKKRKEIINGVKVYRSWLIGRGKGKLRLAINYVSFAISSMIKALFLKKDFDVMMVYQTSPVTMILPAIVLKKITKKPLIIYCLDLWPESLVAIGISAKSFIYKILFKVSKWIYNQGDEIFISSKLFKEYFTDYLGINKPITYLPVYAEGLFEELSITQSNDNIINLVFAGNVGRMQSVETIIYAANELKNLDNIKWHIVGDGSARSNCEKLAKGMGLENVIFHGRHPITEMPRFYEMADAFLITLKGNKVISYTLPNKVQSYMATGKPIIGAIDGETQRIINDAKCGLCCNAEDYSALANNIKKIVQEKHNHVIYSKNSKKYYENNFSKRIFMERFNALLEKIVFRKDV